MKMLKQRFGIYNVEGIVRVRKRVPIEIAGSYLIQNPLGGIGGDIATVNFQTCFLKSPSEIPAATSSVK
jgi:hypothetical protein